MKLSIIYSAMMVISCSLADPLRHNIHNIYIDNAVDDVSQSTDERTKFVDEIQLKFTSVPKSVDAQLGHPLVLECGANGVPQPKIHWLKDGRRVHQSANEDDDNVYEKILNSGKVTIQNGITMSKLKIECVTPYVSAVYQCVADNGYKNIVSSPFTVNVIESDDGRSNCRKNKRDAGVGHAPQIFMWTDSRFEVSGATVQLFCRAKGSPEPVVYWMDNDDNILTDNKKYAVLKNGDLLIKQADWEMMGLFKCVASNEYGKDIAQTFLYPTAPENEDGSDS